MSKEGTVVQADMSFLNAVQSAPVGRRGGDASSERGKVREFFYSKVLDPMVASTKTDKPVKEIELTDVITVMRGMALDADGKTVTNLPVDAKLSKGQRWYFLPNVSATDERYRGIRNYLTGILKSRKEFILVKKWSSRHSKDLTFIAIAEKAPAAPKK